MSFRLERDEPVGAALSRMACEQVDSALTDVQNNELPSHATVHNVRKRCKKIRAIARLFRPNKENLYQRENAFFRDIARTLSGVRDADVLIETLDKLTNHYAGQVELNAFAEIRQFLNENKSAMSRATLDENNRLTKTASKFCDSRDRIAGWPFDDDEIYFILPGFKKTYRRGRNAMKRAYASPTPDNFHEWRKRVKYHYYHTRILRDVWKPVMDARIDEAKRLSDWLGDHHDLAVFRDFLLGEGRDIKDTRALEALLGLIDRRTGELESCARPLGQRMFAQKPKHVTNDIEVYWRAWTIEANLTAPHA